MASFCPYVRTFDKLHPCITGTCDTVVLPDTEACDGRFKLLPCITVTVFDAEGNGIATFPAVLSSWLFELMVADIAETVAACEVLLTGVCDDS